MDLVHLTVRALPGTLLFHDWTEALALWRRLVAAFPDARAICLMPNHPHVVAPDDHARQRFSGVMSGYARWRGARRGQEASCWQRQPDAEPLPDADHVRRMVRYVHLNPCRGGLADDPLAWPLSTHRDHVGLGDLARRVRDPARFHAYVSADPTVSVSGTELPPLLSGAAPLAQVEAAAGAVLRMEPGELRASAAARRICARAAWFRENTDTVALAAWLCVSRPTVYRLVEDPPTRATLDREPTLQAVLRAVGDPRFGPLVSRGLRTRWADWSLNSRGMGWGHASRFENPAAPSHRV